MSGRRSKRWRISRDPANQRLHKVKAWVSEHEHVVEQYLGCKTGLIPLRTIIWRAKHLPRVAKETP